MSRRMLSLSSCVLFVSLLLRCFLSFFFNDPATTEIYTLSLHDALPIFRGRRCPGHAARRRPGPGRRPVRPDRPRSRRDSESDHRSEEHTSELQSRENLVCRLLLEKKKKA